VYVISLESGVSSWSISRRYRDFCYLDEALRKSLKDDANVKLPKLPPKQGIFGSSSTEQVFIDDRKAALESYLQELSAIDQVCKFRLYILCRPGYVFLKWKY
jgi:hypothetical protein